MFSKFVNQVTSLLIFPSNTDTLNTLSFSHSSGQCRRPFKANSVTLTSGSPSTRLLFQTWKPPSWQVYSKTSAAPLIWVRIFLFFFLFCFICYFFQIYSNIWYFLTCLKTFFLFIGIKSIQVLRVMCPLQPSCRMQARRI